MRLTFNGGAKIVTGVNYLLESSGTKILIDCGLFQGASYVEEYNWESFPYDPKEIRAVFVTHAHIDHTGRLPQLVKEGFSGTIYSTEPTKDFAKYLLEDSQGILQKEAKRQNKPLLYDNKDIHSAIAKWKTVKYHQQLTLGPFKITYYNAGHILGSAFILIEAEGKRIIFSGDLGNSPTPIIGAREDIPVTVDYVLIESTYGGRTHEPPKKSIDIIEDLIEDTARRGGTLMIPAFAMERTQQLLYQINQLAENKRIPKVPVFLDSPLAIKLTKVYSQYENYWTKEAAAQIKRGDKLFDFPGLIKTLTTEESKSINDIPPPKVIIAGSGMSNGGRILHHEKRYLSDPNSTLFIVGYQAKGSLGRRIIDGKKSGKPFSIKILGDEILVKANVKAVGGFSAHADQPQLLQWLRPVRESLKKAFIVQGEEDQAAALSNKLRDVYAVNTHIPDHGESVVL